MRKKTNKSSLSRLSAISSDAIRRQLVGGDFISFKVGDDECLIPSYLPASRSIQATILSHPAIFNKTSDEHNLKGRLKYFKQWFLPMSSLVTQHMNRLDGMPDLKQQLSAMMHLLKISENISDDDSLNTSTKLLPSIIHLSLSHQLLQRYHSNDQSIYYFPYITETLGLLNRNLALECFSLMLISMVRQSHIRHSLMDELKSMDVGPIKKLSPDAELSLHKTELRHSVTNHIVFSHESSTPKKPSPSPTSVVETTCLG